VALCAALGLSTPAVAGDRAHDNGFFLRLAGGVGGASTELEHGGSTAKYEGETGDVDFAIGAVVAKNFAIHGSLWGWLASDPEYTLDSLKGSLNGDLGFTAVGAGITYFFMPVNMYLSASVGAGSMTVDVSGDSYNTDTGPAVLVTLGKEWWVGTSWGLGVALSGGYHSVKDGGTDLLGNPIDESWQGGHVALRFSATLN
jgi:hypothetical protein